MQTLILTVLIPIFFSFIFAFLLKQRTVELIPVVFCFAAIWVYAFSTFGKYNLGLFTLIPTMGFFSIIGMYLRRNDLKQIIVKQDFFSPGVVFFALASAWTYFHSKNMKFYEWDEFSYWGSAIKTIFYLKQVPALTNVQGAFPEYIPGIPIFGSIFISAHGSWRESVVFWAYQVLVIALAASILRDFKWKEIHKFLLGLLVTLFAVFYFYNPFQSVYADPLMSILFGASVILAASTKLIENKSYLLNYAIIIAFLAITKDIAIYFVAISFAVLVINITTTSLHKSLSLFEKLKKCLNLIFIPFLLILVIKYLWSSLIKQQNLSGGRDIFSYLSGVLQGKISLNSNPDWNQIKLNFINRVTDQPLTNINGLPITTLNSLIILSFVLFFVFLNTQGIENKLRNLLISFTLSVGGFTYLGLLLFLYATVFVTPEALGLASFDRYVGAYIGGMVLVLSSRFSTFLKDSEKLEKNFKVISVLLFFFLLQSSPSKIFGYIFSPNTYSDQIRSSYNMQSSLASQMKLTGNEKIWIIAQHTVGFEFYLIQYELIPGKVGKIPFSLGSASGPGDIWTDTSYTADKWESALIDYDYVFVNNSTESFKSEFGELFEQPESLDQVPGVYKIESYEGKIQLIRVL